MKKALYIFLFLFVSKCYYSQTLEKEFKKYRDSIQTLSSYDSTTFFKIVEKLKNISEKNKSAVKRADILQIIGTYYYFRQDFTKTNLYFDSAIAILKRNPDNKLENLIDLKRNFILMNNGEYEKAKISFNKKEAVIISQHDTTSMILLNMGRGQIFQGEQRFDESVKYFLKALSFALSSNDKYYEATIRNNLGGVYIALGNIPKAKDEYFKAVDIAKKIGNKKLTSSLTTNIASIYIQEKKPQEALGILKENISFYENTNFYYEISYGYLGIAYCYSELKNISLMKQFSAKSINIITSNNLPLDAINIYTQVMLLYINNNLIEEGVNIANEAINFTNTNKLRNPEPNFFKYLSILFEKSGNNERALFYHKKYSSLNDSINNIKNLRQANDLVYKYELAEKEKNLIIKEKENTLLRNQNELYKVNRKLYLTIVTLFLLILVFITFYLVQKRLKRQREEYAAQLINDIDKERERIAMDLHDDLGLGITMVKNKIMNEETLSEYKRNEIQKTLQDILEHTRNISRELFPATLKHLKIEEFIEPLLKQIEEKSNVICSYEIDPIIDKYSLEYKMHVIRILQECIHNSLKYSMATAIRVEVIYEKPKIQIIYYDNGIGLKETKQNNGLGFQNIYQRAKQIAGSLDINNNENGKGIKITITVYDRN